MKKVSKYMICSKKKQHPEILKFKDGELEEEWIKKEVNDKKFFMLI